MYVCIDRIASLLLSCVANGLSQLVLPYAPGPSNWASGTLARIALT